MPIPTPIELADLTTSLVNGEGVFDVLMRANKAHLDQEFAKNRIKGPEYAQVYLGSLQTVLATALQFVMQKNAANQETELKAKQIELLTSQVAQAEAQILQIEAQTLLINQQRANAVLEGTVLVAQECKLRAEYDVIILTKDKTITETTLLSQKLATEKAQVLALGVDADSLIGRQKSLYVGQTNGFLRDAEQKAAKLLVDTWSVRRTTNDTTPADATNKLNDATIGSVVTKLLAGVGA